VDDGHCGDNMLPLQARASLAQFQVFEIAPILILKISVAYYIRSDCISS
jgi:hypothetical protein